ncbi:MAG: hypothetical protein HY064_12110 [Bacteroidetes bacterium]|nr:hypothetical protein [Bacteroidota bacterium]
MTGNEFILTFDVDWAPDFMLRFIRKKLSSAGIRSTWFITHESPAIREMLLDPMIEIGLHPNFLPGSSHGNSTEEVMDHLLKIAPAARSVRSHAVVQSGQLLNYYAKKTKIKIDSTIFLPEMPHIRPVNHLLPDGNLVRVPFFWADDYELCKSEKEWKLKSYSEMPGLKVMMFHPVNIFLNTPSLNFYAAFKKNNPDMKILSEESASAAANKSQKGVENFFVNLIEYLSGKPTWFLHDTLKLI